MSHKKKKKLFSTMGKILLGIIIIHGMMMITASYVLSFMDKDPVCEVSVVLITEIVAPYVTYMLTKTVENIFEKNKLTFSEPIKQNIIENEED